MRGTSASMRFFVGLSRLLLAALFIFSGFVKAVDPFGLSLQFDAYFKAFNMPWASVLSDSLSIALPSAELLIGLMLLFGISLRFMSAIVLIFMSFFTFLTLIIAIFNPVSDCGCFGNAIKLTNWETLLKNVAIMPFAIVLFMTRRRFTVSKVPATLQMLFVAFLMAFSVSVSWYSFVHQPIIDFLPFKVGVDIKESMSVPTASDEHITLLYKDKMSGVVTEFEVADTTWQDTVKWVYVDTKSVKTSKLSSGEQADFSVFLGPDDYTAVLLDNEGFSFVLIAKNPSMLNTSAVDSLATYCKANSLPMVVLTSSAIEDSIFKSSFPIYNCDDTTLKSIIRGDAGLMLLHDGIIAEKWILNDIPKFTESPVSLLIRESEKTKMLLAFSVATLTLIILLILYRISVVHYGIVDYKRWS